MSKLIVTAFKDGSLIRVGSNPEFGTMMVAQSATNINAGGFLETRTLLGFVKDKVESLKALNLSEGSDFNAKLEALGGSPCRVIVQESNTPHYEGQSPKINPESKEVILDANDAPIYYDTKIVAQGSNEQDVKIASKGSAQAQAEEVVEEATAEAGDMA